MDVDQNALTSLLPFVFAFDKLRVNGVSLVVSLSPLMVSLSNHHPSFP